MNHPISALTRIVQGAVALVILLAGNPVEATLGSCCVRLEYTEPELYTTCYWECTDGGASPDCEWYREKYTSTGSYNTRCETGACTEPYEEELDCEGESGYFITKCTVGPLLKGPGCDTVNVCILDLDDPDYCEPEASCTSELGEIVCEQSTICCPS